MIKCKIKHPLAASTTSLSAAMMGAIPLQIHAYQPVGGAYAQVAFQPEPADLFYEPRILLAETGGAAGAGEEAPAGGEGVMSAEEAARQSSNPLGGNFWILLNQFDNYFMQGDATNKTRNINTWAFQPVVPFPVKGLGEHWIWVNRPTFPVIINADLPDGTRLGPARTTPDFPPGFPPPGGIPPGGLPFTSESGFGDIVYFSLLGQSLPQERWGGGDFVWAGGLTTQWPSASRDELGSGKYSAGPSGVLAFIGKEFILGGLFQQWWSYASADSSAEDVNFSWLNMFYFLNFPDGWQVGGTPIITADWENDSDNRWTVPLGLGVYKTHRFAGLPGKLSKMPIKMGVEMQYMPVQPDIYGQEWNIRIVFAPIIPKLF